MLEKVITLFPQLAEVVEQYPELTKWIGIGTAIAVVVVGIVKLIDYIGHSLSGFQKIRDHKNKVLIERIESDHITEDLRELLKKQLCYSYFEKETGIIGSTLYEPIIALLKKRPKLTLRIFMSSASYLVVKDGELLVRFNRWDKAARVLNYLGALGFLLYASLFAKMVYLINDIKAISFYVYFFLGGVVVGVAVQLFVLPIVKYSRAKELKSTLEKE